MINHNSDEYHSPETKIPFLNNKIVFKDLIYYKKLLSSLYAISKKANKVDNYHEYLINKCLDFYKIIEKTGARIHIKGLNNLQKEPVVFVGNHMSSLETFMLPAILSKAPLSFALKQSLLKYPFFNKILLKMDCIALTRTSPKEDLKTIISKGMKNLKENKNVMIFPQGRAEFNRNNFTTIACKLAYKAKVPLQTIALKTDFMPQGKIFKDLGAINPKKDVYYNISPIQSVTKENQKQVHTYCLDFIENSLKSWQD